ncbi:NUDIX hydrolase [Streptomyces sp. CBMA29]|uniref:NUDIX hydrolase n=1 Tax=Streptomyces sp. CBMA29 TaxID=1896314 RepID=UPI001661FF41|nr:NUDIX domain-containing protein [Streptomyces sp. CBMA29]MBD0738170.1 NUDIX hydrolase [Streptomyces sp. CBMA29]
MTITADHIRATLAEYTDAHPEEKPALAVVNALLDDGAELTDRKEYRGHVTAGAVLINDAGEVLFIRHVALDTWLTPGGHVEPEDVNLVGAALRELIEETGIALNVSPVFPVPVHIDVHPIPENPHKGEDAHRHIDFRYLFRAVGEQSIRPQEEEVSACAWRSADTIADETLKNRVRAALL